MPKAIPAEKISTISGSATTHASLCRPSAFQLSVIFACSAFIAAKLLLCAILKPPTYHPQCGRNRAQAPGEERSSLLKRSGAGLNPVVRYADIRWRSLGYLDPRFSQVVRQIHECRR